MTPIGRAFVAIRLPDDVLDSLDRFVAGLRPHVADARWLPRDTWHLTLRFLGRVDDVSALVERLGTLRGRPGVALHLGGLGAFPSTSRARVLWVGCSEGSESFARLASTVDRAVAPLGFGPPDHPASPHVSIARFRTPRHVGATVDSLDPGPVGDPWTVDTVGLYRSTTHADGAVYDELASVPLA